MIVVGGGFTGMSTALHLREAGVDVAIVEAAQPGSGASGRNNGQVIPTLSKPDPEDIIAKHRRRGRAFRRRCCATAPRSCSTSRKRYDIKAEQEQSRLDPAGPSGQTAPTLLSGGCGNSRSSARRSKCSRAGTVRDMLGSDAWYGGFWNQTGGHINPLALARGLARTVLASAGASMRGRQPHKTSSARRQTLGGEDRKG